jgi:anti-sigma factor RsiW
MIRCRELATLMVDYFADELPPRQHASIRAHLEWCPNCSSDVELYQQVMQATRELPDAPVPEPLLDRLRETFRNPPQ